MTQPAKQGFLFWVRCFALLWIGALSLVHTQGATIIFSAEQDNGISTVDGTELAVGNQILVGSFNLTDAEIEAHASDLQFLSAHFVAFGAGHVGDIYAGVNGHFSMTLTNNSAALGLANAQIYIWAFKTTANDDPNASFSNVTEHGIFYADMDVVNRWRIRPENEIPNSTHIDLSDLTNPAGTALNNSANILVGGFGTGTSSTFAGKPNFNLAAVIPEPATASLLIFSVISLGVRRWR